MLCIEVSDQTLSFFMVSPISGYLKIVNEHTIQLPEHCIYEDKLFDLDTLSTSITNYLTKIKCCKPFTLLSIPHLKKTTSYDAQFHIFQSLISIKKIPIILQVLTTEPISLYKDEQDPSKISRTILDPRYNILTPYTNHINTSPLTWLRSTALATAALIFGFCFLTLSIKDETKIIKIKNKELTEQTKELHQKIQACKKLLMQKNEDKKKIAFSEKLLNEHKNIHYLLEVLSQSIPEQTMITQFHLTKHTEKDGKKVITLDGITANPEEALFFTQKFAQAAALHDIKLTKLNYVAEQEKNPESHYQFQLQGIVKN